MGTRKSIIFILITLISQRSLAQGPNEGAQIAAGLANAVINTIFPQLNAQGQPSFLRQQPNFNGIPVLTQPGTILDDQRGTFGLQSFPGTGPLGNDLFGNGPVFQPLSQLSGSFLQPPQVARAPGIGVGSSLRAPAPPGSTGNLLEDFSRVGILPALINLARPAIANGISPPTPAPPAFATDLPDKEEKARTVKPDRSDKPDKPDLPEKPENSEKPTIRLQKPVIASGGFGAPGGAVPQEPNSLNLIDSLNGSPFVITNPSGNAVDQKLKTGLLVGQQQPSPLLSALQQPQSPLLWAAQSGLQTGLTPSQGLQGAFTPSQGPSGAFAPQTGLLSGAIPPQPVAGPAAWPPTIQQQAALAQLLQAQGLSQGLPPGFQLPLPAQQVQLQGAPAAGSSARSRLITSNSNGGENFGSDCPQCIPIDLTRLSGPWVQVYGNPQALKTIYTSVAHLESLYGDDSVQSNDFSVIQPSCVGIQFSKPQKQGRRSESTMNIFFRDDTGTKQLHEAVGRVKQDVIASPHAVNFKLPAFDLPMCLVKSGPETSTMYGYVILAETIGTNRCRSYHVFTRQADTFFRDHNTEVAAYLKEQVEENSVKPVGVLPFPDLCQLQNISKISRKA